MLVIALLQGRVIAAPSHDRSSAELARSAFIEVVGDWTEQPGNVALKRRHFPNGSSSLSNDSERVVLIKRPLSDVRFRTNRNFSRVAIRLTWIQGLPLLRTYRRLRV